MPSSRVESESTGPAVHPPSDNGLALTLEHVKMMITSAGIVHGLDLDAAASAIEEAAATNLPLHNIVIAKGHAPENGRDALIGFKFQLDRLAGTLIKGSDRIDYHERRSIQNVKKGDLLSIKAPPSKGRDGLDVFGKVVPAEPGKDIKLIPAGNVSLSDDGLTMTSEIDGMVILKDNHKIGVFRLYEIQGDVDLKTGNLTMDGALHIPDISSLFVEDAMTKPAITVNTELSVYNCHQIMRMVGVRRMPVVDRGKLVGIISNSDIFTKFT